VTDPNNPALGFSSNSPGKRLFAVATYSKDYFGIGSTTISMFLDSHTNGNTSYIFASDANGDGNSSNDLIYVPRNESEMNFAPFTLNGATVTAQQQADAFESYIEHDSYLKSRRGQYAERNGVFLPMVTRLDLSLSQEIFHSSGSHRNSGAIRLDITNVGNLLNHNWGVGQRLVANAILTNPGVDASGALNYRLATVGTSLVTTPLQTSAGIADVYVMMLSFRYTFR
jgi:hypothetical protein